MRGSFLWTSAIDLKVHIPYTDPIMKRTTIEVIVDVDDYAAKYEMDGLREAIKKVLDRHDAVKRSWVRVYLPIDSTPTREK